LASGYCASGPTGAGNFGLGYIFSNNIMIGNYGSACPPVVGVQELPDTLNFNRSSAYRIRHNAGFCNSTQMTISGDGWIDWNHNHMFETHEKVWTYRTENTASYTATVFVPGDALLGSTRLRLQVRQGPPSGNGPCDPFLYGGTKDITIIVSDPLATLT